MLDHLLNPEDEDQIYNYYTDDHPDFVEMVDERIAQMYCANFEDYELANEDDEQIVIKDLKKNNLWDDACGFYFDKAHDQIYEKYHNVETERQWRRVYG